MYCDTKTVLLILAVLLLGFLLMNRQFENFESSDWSDNFAPVDHGNEHTYQVQNEGGQPEGEYILPNDYSPPETNWMKGKFNTRNTSHGDYKSSSYSSGRRGQLSTGSDWNQFFDNNNNVIGNGLTGENDKFLPIDESHSGHAAYQSSDKAKCGSNQNCEPEDLYDIEKYLPQEVNDDWFEVQPEPISVKNRHLINITKPIGVNTIGTSKKIASYDLRGRPMCPKFVVSPWLGSSVEPDNNLKPLY